MLWTLKKCWYRIYQRVFKVAMCFMDWSAPQLLEGAGSVLRLPELIKSKGVKKVLVVTDKGLIALHSVGSAVCEIGRGRHCLCGI